MRHYARKHVDLLPSRPIQIAKKPSGVAEIRALSRRAALAQCWRATEAVLGCNTFNYNREAARDEEHLALIRKLGITFAIGAPLISRGQSL